jgi:hypothetical protein
MDCLIKRVVSINTSNSMKNAYSNSAVIHVVMVLAFCRVGDTVTSVNSIPMDSNYTLCSPIFLNLSTESWNKRFAYTRPFHRLQCILILLHRPIVNSFKVATSMQLLKIGNRLPSSFRINQGNGGQI